MLDETARNHCHYRLYIVTLPLLSAGFCKGPHKYQRAKCVPHAADWAPGLHGIGAVLTPRVLSTQPDPAQPSASLGLFSESILSHLCVFQNYSSINCRHRRKSAQLFNEWYVSHSDCFRFFYINTTIQPPDISWTELTLFFIHVFIFVELFQCRSELRAV